MLLLFILTAVFIAWIWVDYYRLIDIYETEELKYFILVFFLGALSTQVTLGAHDLFIQDLGFDLNGNLLNDILYCTIEIGMLEEFSKLLPFVIMLLFFRKQINEPIDYISYVCVSALGFSAAENVIYFSNFGAEIISGRSILSSLGHMMFAAFSAYGIILYKYKKSKFGWWIILLFFILGSFAHGMFDFWLMHYDARLFGYIITVLFFLQMVSMFASMLNNALNNSAFFSYKKVIDSDKVGNRLLLYYLGVFLLQFTILSIDKGIAYSLSNINLQTFMVAIIIYICSIRLSRFKLIRNKWFPLKLDMPFHIKKINRYKDGSTRGYLAIRGDDYNEVYLNQFYDDHLWLNPLSKRKSYLKSSKKAFIEKKIFLKNYESYYVTKLYLDQTETRFEYVLLKPKLIGKSFTTKKSPIVAILRIKELVDLTNEELKMNDFQFIEWAYPKAYDLYTKG